MAMDLVLMMYEITRTFPVSENYGLTSQIRRAAVSIPSNIAEGASRRSKKEYSQFLYVAKGSLSELDTQLELAQRLNYLPIMKWQNVNEQMVEIDKMLSGLITHQRKS